MAPRGIPTTRQLQAFHLRCDGLTYEEVGQRMGITDVTAQALAKTAAVKLITHQPPRLHMVNNAALAREHFPQIAARHPLKPAKVEEPA